MGDAARLHRAGNRGVELRLGPLDRLSVSVAIAPYVSTLSLLTDAFRGRTTGLSRTLTSAVRDIRETVDPTPVRPIIAPGHSLAPDVIVPIVPREDIPASAHLEHLRAAPDTAVLEDLGETFGDAPPTHWSRVAQRPRHWLYGYADAASRSWELLRPLWESSQSLLSREIDRVAVASARRQHDVLFSGLSPKVGYADGSLFFPDTEPATYDLDGRPLVLIPMMSAADAVIANFDQPDVVWIGYPLAGLGSLTRPRPSSSGEDAAEFVLGGHRADILRALDRATSMGELAERLHYSPSTLTHHCNRLAQAGLLFRERRGRTMVLRRTERGTSLLDVLSGG